eukprot:62990-Amorphochlora_amoeboformis.AAC.1
MMPSPGGPSSIPASSQTVKIEPTNSSDNPASDHWSGTGNSGPTTELRPDRRMARKAELARESRKRKKEFIQNLQEKARRYAEKVEQLEKRQVGFVDRLIFVNSARISLMDTDLKTGSLHDNPGTNFSDARRAEFLTIYPTQKRRQEQLRLLGEMVTQLESKSSLPEKNKKLEIFMETFTSNSRARQKQLDGLMDKVREVLTPGLQAKFCLTINSTTIRRSGARTCFNLPISHCFQVLANIMLYRRPSLAYQELGISIDQSERLKSHRKQIKERRENLRKILENLEDVRKKAQGHVTSLNNVRYPKLFGNHSTYKTLHETFSTWILNPPSLLVGR